MLAFERAPLKKSFFREIVSKHFEEQLLPVILLSEISRVFLGQRVQTNGYFAANTWCNMLNKASCLRKRFIKFEVVNEVDIIQKSDLLNHVINRQA